MPKAKDTPCSQCGALTWWHSKSSRPKGQLVCQPCRRRKPARPGRTVPLDVQLGLMREAANRPVDLTCPTCQTGFRARKGRVYCDECRESRRGAHYRRKSAERRSGSAGYRDTITGELITITALGDRDSWTCWRCSQFVNRALRFKDPWMPSFDHVVPISKGGLDSWDNLKLAHLVCNVKAGNK